MWIGHREDVRAWDLLRDAREVYERAAQRRIVEGETIAQSGARATRRCWRPRAAIGTGGTGPEHGSANDAEFDELYRKHLTEIYAALGEQAPDALAHPIKKAPEQGRREPPEAYLHVTVDGRETSYFEWLGAGLYATDPRGGTMHGRTRVLGELRYGFGETHFYLRVDPDAGHDCGNSGFSIAGDIVGFARDAHHGARAARESSRVACWSKAECVCCIRKDW